MLLQVIIWEKTENMNLCLTRSLINKGMKLPRKNQMRPLMSTLLYTTIYVKKSSCKKTNSIKL